MQSEFLNSLQQFFSNNKVFSLTNSTTSSAQQPVLPIAATAVSEQEIVRYLILNQMSTRRKNNHDSNQPLHPALNAAAETIKSLWAASTWNARASLWQRLEQFVTERNLRMLPFGAQAAAFVSSLQVTKQTLYSYAKTFRALASRFQIPTPVLDMYIAALYANGATIPIEQATPATRDQVRFLVEKAIDTDTRLSVAVYIAWKCAARWDDVRNLTKESLIFSDENQAVIEWGQTKTTRGNPFRVSGWTVIEEPRYPVMLYVMRNSFQRLKEKEHLYSMPTQMLTRWMHTFPETEKLSGHSFKRGAMGVLVEAASQGKLEPRIIPTLLKHQDPLWDFPMTTLRYAPNKVDLARMLGTQNATTLL
jgi:hypothetical protein